MQAEMLPNRSATPAPAPTTSRGRERLGGTIADLFSPETSTWTDVQLIAACNRGNQGAWNELVERYSRLVYSIPLKYGLSAAAADDIFQQVFLTVYRRLETLRDAERFSAWLARTTHRQTARYRRSQLNDQGLDFVADRQEAPGEELSRLEDQHIARRAMQLLSERDRQLLDALFFGDDGPSYAQVAERLGIPIGSIGPTRARCLRRLERALDQCGYVGHEIPRASAA